jgi:uncharacterized protein
MFTNKGFEESRRKAEELLRTKLPELEYHNYAHTMDVVQAAQHIGTSEKISEHEMAILLTAATLHDSGYIKTRNGHEEESCRIADALLSEQGVSKADIDTVCSLIMATKVPQSPTDKLAKIICDADLDYLGRDDFFEIGHRVYLEFRRFGIVKDEIEWNKMQINFLEHHKYFTKTSIENRHPKKMEHLTKLKEMVGIENLR